MEHPIGQIIAGLRRKKGITQEQLADAVGVSAPAVSKWETNASCPDIALLSPIARALDTDVNTLLSFTAACPPETLTSIFQDLRQQTDGSAALEQMRALAQRYPGDWNLLFQLASMAISLPAFNDWPEETRTAARAFAEESLEQARLHGGAKLWPNAAYTLAALRMEAGDLDQAEALLNSLPAMETPSPWPLFASLYRQRGEIEKARTTIRAQMMLTAQALLSLLRMLCSPEYALSGTERALNAYRAVSEAMGDSPISYGVTALTCALKEGRTGEALDALPALAREAAEGAPPWYLWEEAPIPAEEYHRQMSRVIRNGLLTDGEFAPFREDPRYREALRTLEQIP